MSNTVTRIKLNKKYKNVIESTDYRITAPDGYSFVYTIVPSGGIKDYIEHTGGKIEPITERREKRNIALDGIRLDQVEPDILELRSDSKKAAHARYNKIKEALKGMGYTIEHHSCTEEPTAKRTRVKCPDLQQTLGKNVMV